MTAKDLTAKLQGMTPAIAIALGAKKWVGSSGTTRYYFNNLNDLYGLRLSYYNTGNISAATLDGDKISNRAARQINSELYMAKVWLDESGTMNFRGLDRKMARAIGTEIQRRVKQQATARFTSDLIRRAWAIRRDAAARMGCRVMDVVWGECLKMARAG